MEMKRNLFDVDCLYVSKGFKAATRLQLLRLLLKGSSMSLVTREDIGQYALLMVNTAVSVGNLKYE
jgi:hypothetical protein